MSAATGNGILGPARGLYRLARYAPDRLLHDQRHRRASDIIAKVRLRSVLFLCYGNICRSPFAARLLERRLIEARPRFEVDSAGFFGPMRPSPPAAVAAAARFGVDLSTHRSQLIKPAMVDTADLILAMNPGQARQAAAMASRRSHFMVLGDLEPGPAPTREIPDPWGRDHEFFAASYGRVAVAVEHLARLLIGKP